jgi:hypothetical protein
MAFDTKALHAIIVNRTSFDMLTGNKLSGNERNES